MELQDKRKLAVVILTAILLLLGIQQILPQESSTIVVQTNGSENAEDSISRPETISNDIVVHVAGAVENPGVYTLQLGQRVEDALQKAGIAENADVDALNRAALLNDGQKIMVPFADDAHTVNQQIDLAPDHNTAEQNIPINLNNATLSQLLELPGIGEVKANAIIRYRQEHGSFQSVDELLLVSGIGHAIYAQVVELVCV